MTSGESSIEPLKEKQDRCRPFIKWVGGKSQLLPELLKRIPHFTGCYREPFLGGAALYFALKPRRSVLSDINAELINVFQVVQSQVEELIIDLAQHRYEKEYFYRIREVDRTPEYKDWSAVARASRLIYLNKSCFNGLYRVSAQGYFNTPFGRYTNPTILNADNLRECSAVLQGSEIVQASFLDFEQSVTKDDFVYFDPPYVPLSQTANFTSYADQGFGLKRQEELYQLCVRLNQKGVRFMLSNSSAPFVLERYQEFNMMRVRATRAINSKAALRGAIDEVIVTNYLWGPDGKI
jgi:DNA adenine methylase